MGIKPILCGFAIRRLSQSANMDIKFGAAREIRTPTTGSQPEVSASDNGLTIKLLLCLSALNLSEKFFSTIDSCAAWAFVSFTRVFSLSFNSFSFDSHILSYINWSPEVESNHRHFVPNKVRYRNASGRMVTRYTSLAG